MGENLPSVTAVLPTLNAERHLAACLRSIREQQYSGAVEIILADAGSTDRTLEIAEEFGVEQVLPNPLRSGEAGKAVGVKAAQGDLILLIDSDNTLVGSDWLKRMVKPFIEDPEVIGCEPARFEYQRDDHFINRWHALTGVVDPLTLYVGNYARESVITGTWTGFPHETTDRDGWQRVVIDENWVPVLGANGFIMRRSAYDLVPVGDYLFDLDHVYDLVRDGHRVFARADVGVHHAFCDGVAKFRAKTRRRVDDFLYFASEGSRSYPWSTQRNKSVARFALATVFVIPVVVTALRGFWRKPDLAAWAWHPVACWLTLVIYAAGVIRGKLRPRMFSREKWSQ